MTDDMNPTPVVPATDAPEETTEATPEVPVEPTPSVEPMPSPSVEPTPEETPAAPQE